MSDIFCNFAAVCEKGLSGGWLGGEKKDQN